MDGLRLLNFAVALIGAGLWSAWLVRNRRQWGYAIAPLTYLLHVIVYYGSRPWLWMAPMDINMWSTIVRTHSLVLFAGMAIIYLLDKRNA